MQPSRQAVSDIDGVIDCLGPEVGVDSLWPPMLCVKQHCACRFGDVSYATFGDTDLVVRANATKGHGLHRLFDTVNESLVCKAPVVAVIMFYCYSVGSSETFESLLGFDRLLRGQRFHVVDVREVGEVVCEDGRGSKPSIGEVTF